MEISLIFPRKPTSPVKVFAIFCPQWKGDLLLGWRTLRELGFTFKLDADYKPIAVCLAKLGIEVEILEREDADVRLARSLGDAIDFSIYQKETCRLENTGRRN